MLHYVRWHFPYLFVTVLLGGGPMCKPVGGGIIVWSWNHLFCLCASVLNLKPLPYQMALINHSWMYSPCDAKKKKKMETEKKRLLEQTHNNITRPTSEQVTQGQYISLHRYPFTDGFLALQRVLNVMWQIHWQSVNENKVGSSSALQINLDSKWRQVGGC